MTKYSKHINKKLEQSNVDDWMCENLNNILDTIFNRSTRLTAGAALVEVEHVMRLANRRKEGGKDNDFRFSDSSRSNYKFNPVEN